MKKLIESRVQKTMSDRTCTKCGRVIKSSELYTRNLYREGDNLYVSIQCVSCAEKESRCK